MDTHTRGLLGLIFTFVFIASSIPCSSAQDISRFNFQDTVKPISIRGAIQQALRDNHDQRIRDYENRALDLGWDGDWQEFWLPTVTLGLSASKDRITRLKQNTRKSTNPRLPDGVASLDFGEWTVFNWGKDYLDYLNKKQTYRRGKQTLVEQRRALRHAVIIKYFELVTKKEVEQVRRDQLRYASFIYRLNTERVKSGKIKKQDYYQARSEYLLAQRLYQRAKRELNLTNEQLAYYLDDPVGTKYITKEKLEFKRVQANLNDISLLTDRNAPGILQAKTDFDLSWRNHEIARRENLMLPKFTFDLGVYSQAFTRTQFGGVFTTDTGGSSFEIVATLNASWTLLGPNGLFNMRSLDQSLIDRGQANRELLKQTDLHQSQVRRAYEQILTYEKELKILQVRTSNAKKTYDIVMDNYTRSRTPFVNFLHALRDLSDAEVDMAETKWEHLQQKVLLASYAGMEEFPGENFEVLAKRIPRIDELLKDDKLPDVPQMKEEGP